MSDLTKSIIGDVNKISLHEFIPELKRIILDRITEKELLNHINKNHITVGKRIDWEGLISREILPGLKGQSHKQNSIINNITPDFLFKVGEFCINNIEIDTAKTLFISPIFDLETQTRYTYDGENYISEVIDFLEVLGICSFLHNPRSEKMYVLTNTNNIYSYDNIDVSKERVLEIFNLALHKDTNLSELNVYSAITNLKLINEVSTHYHDNKYFTKVLLINDNLLEIQSSNLLKLESKQLVEESDIIKWNSNITLDYLSDYLDIVYNLKFINAILYDDSKIKKYIDTNEFLNLPPKVGISNKNKLFPILGSEEYETHYNEIINQNITPTVTTTTIVDFDNSWGGPLNAEIFTFNKKENGKYKFIITVECDIACRSATIPNTIKANCGIRLTCGDYVTIIDSEELPTAPNINIPFSFYNTYTYDIPNDIPVTDNVNCYIEIFSDHYNIRVSRSTIKIDLIESITPEPEAPSIPIHTQILTYGEVFDIYMYQIDSIGNMGVYFLAYSKNSGGGYGDLYSAKIDESGNLVDIHLEDLTKLMDGEQAINNVETILYADKYCLILGANDRNNIHIIRTNGYLNNIYYWVDIIYTLPNYLTYYDVSVASLGIGFGGRNIMFITADNSTESFMITTVFLSAGRTSTKLMKYSDCLTMNSVDSIHANISYTSFMLYTQTYPRLEMICCANRGLLAIRGRFCVSVVQTNGVIISDNTVYDLLFQFSFDYYNANNTYPDISDMLCVSKNRITVTFNKEKTALTVNGTNSKLSDDIFECNKYSYNPTNFSVTKMYTHRDRSAENMIFFGNEEIWKAYHLDLEDYNNDKSMKYFEVPTARPWGNKPGMGLIYNGIAYIQNIDPNIHNKLYPITPIYPNNYSQNEIRIDKTIKPSMLIPSNFATEKTSENSAIMTSIQPFRQYGTDYTVLYKVYFNNLKELISAWWFTIVPPPNNINCTVIEEGMIYVSKKGKPYYFCYNEDYEFFVMIGEGYSNGIPYYTKIDLKYENDNLTEYWKEFNKTKIIKNKPIKTMMTPYFDLGTNKIYFKFVYSILSDGVKYSKGVVLSCSFDVETNTFQYTGINLNFGGDYTDIKNIASYNPSFGAYIFNDIGDSDPQNTITVYHSKYNSTNVDIESFFNNPRYSSYISILFLIRYVNELEVYTKQVDVFIGGRYFKLNSNIVQLPPNALTYIYLYYNKDVMSYPEYRITERLGANNFHTIYIGEFTTTENKLLHFKPYDVSNSFYN